MHDWAYGLGFNEVNWNGQKRNFGLTEAWQQGDPVTGNAQAGAGIPTPAGFVARNNANMATLADGLSSITNMYLWQPSAGSFYPPCADGDFDMPIIGHEYGHMIENRMIGKGLTRQGGHAGMMGESHGDLFGMEYVNSNGFVPVAGENRYAVGAYATGNQSRAIRNYGMNMPTAGGDPQPGKQLLIDTLNFGSMGYDVTGPQVHADGEIWSRTNFNIRERLIEKYDDDYPADDQELQTECAEGITPAHRCPGNRRWIQLVFDAMLLMPVNPTMLQARDAALAADLMRFGGANQKEMWLGYAQGGMGVNASATSENDFDPVPDFEPVGSKAVTVRFKAENDDARSDQRQDLRRSLRGPCLTDCRHESHDVGTDQPRRHGQVRSGQVRVRRACARIRACSLRPRSPVEPLAQAQEQEPDGRDRVPDQLGFGHVGGNRYDPERRGDSRGAHRRHRGHAVDRERGQLHWHADAGITGRRSLGGRQAGDGRPRRERGDSRPLRPGQRPHRAEQRPVRTGAAVRALGV